MIFLIGINLKLFWRKLESVKVAKSNVKFQYPKVIQKNSNIRSSSFIVSNNQSSQKNMDTQSCFVCKENGSYHNCGICPVFLKISTHDRFTRVKELKLCINCLKLIIIRRRNVLKKDVRFVLRNTTHCFIITIMIRKLYQLIPKVHYLILQIVLIRIIIYNKACLLDLM